MLNSTLNFSYSYPPPLKKPYLRRVLKINSCRLKKSNWNLKVPLEEAIKNEEVISISESQVLRWIDEIRNIHNPEENISSIRKNINLLKRECNSPSVKKEIKKLYLELDKIQYKSDYVCIELEKEKDLKRACKGFKINGIEYERLVGTNGGVKNGTIVFINKEIAHIIKARIDNGRNMAVPFVPAKLEAYRALVCSASRPVSLPKGILVVKDCETIFNEDIIYITDELEGEPCLSHIPNAEVKLTESDGYGIMLPSLAQRWSDELHLGYLMSGCNTRFSYEKGMTFTFDFIDFAEKFSKSYIVKDIWGTERDIRNVEIILTASMLKLWMCYDNLEQYLENCLRNKYNFSITKECPEELESERCLNYQFLQSYELTDSEIDDLINPTLQEFKEILSEDYKKTILFLKGCDLNSSNVKKLEDDFVKAIMIDKRVHEDPFIRKKILRFVKKKINEAKVGVIKVHGNYSIVCGDPFSLCQSIFGLEVTGVLKKGEIYNKYWLDQEVEKVSCFRAPMTCHNNIRLMNIHDSEDARYWYRFMNTCTLFNSWDSSAHALNGMDKHNLSPFLVIGK